MSSIKSKLQTRTWTKENYYISTDSSLLPLSEVNAAFASDSFYWANPLPEDVMRETFENSLCFGLYEVPSRSTTEAESTTSASIDKLNLKFVGLARCITDFTTFVYLTDVYVDPSQQGGGLGKWLVACVREVLEDMPYIRRSMLFTSDWERSVPFYIKHMKMTVYDSGHGQDGTSDRGPAMLQRLGKANPYYKGED